jgi:GDSL-like Lipase/Acylhydrolase family
MNSVALRRLLAITLTLFLTATLTYVVPSFERVRPWVRGEGIPVVRLFVGEKQPIELPDFQGATATAAAVATAEVAEEVAAEAPVQPAATSPSHDATPQPPPPPVRRARVAAKEYAGATTSIENVQALAGFYASLRRSAQGAAGAITRIAHYGDSSVAADEITRTARRKLQSRFGDAGHGFMLTARGNMFYGHRDIVHHESDGWELVSIVRRSLRSGYYGYGGVVATGQNGDYTSYGTVGDGPIGRSVSRFEVFYQRYAAGGELRLSVDGNPPETVQTQAATPEDAWQVVRVPDGEHSLAVRAHGEVRVYGVSQERDVPGVVYDALGLVGARADRLLDADPKHMAGQIAHRDPDLLVLGFGGNEAGNDYLDMGRYERDLVKVVRLMRSGKPRMSCLLFGPLDQGARNDRGDVVTLRALPGIVDVQRRVALSEGCGFFDTYQAMGGQGSVQRWYRARPRLFSPDFRHATPEGYALIGEVYYQALLKGFAEYSEKR